MSSPGLEHLNAATASGKLTDILAGRSDARITVAEVNAATKQESPADRIAKKLRLQRMGKLVPPGVRPSTSSRSKHRPRRSPRPSRTCGT
jgi:hypothetical protein